LNHTLYESDGGYNKSTVHQYSINFEDENPRLQDIVTKKFPGRYFSEGLAVDEDNVYILTWKEKTLFSLHRTGLAPDKKMS